MSETVLRKTGIAVCCLILASSAMAQNVWVSDEFEVMLRTGPTTANAIERVLSSGTELVVVETDANSGYSKVRTLGGTEGWVLTRYLMGEPSAREQLQRLTSQLTDSKSRGSTLGAQLEAIRSEQQSTVRKADELDAEKQKLDAELQELRKKSANVLAIDAQNKSLRQQLTDAEIKVSILEQETEELSGQKDRYWFITGALVLLGGIVLGLILPRLKFQRRSRYDRL